MHEERVKISVIMGIYNQQNTEQLSEAIHSVLEQSFREFEFIIYNDGSDADVTEYLRECSRLDDRIRFIDSPVNHGLAYSLNSCIGVARGKYIARMDGDDICLPKRLQIQYDYLEQHPEIAFVGGNACLLEDNDIWGVRRMPASPNARDFLRYSPYIHPSIMIRRSVFEETEGYHTERGTLRCEDYELFMRLWRLGYQGHNLQQELLLYREDRASYQKRRWCYRIDEMKLRYRNFKELHILFPDGWIYVLRPLAAAIVPGNVILGVKKLYCRAAQRKLSAAQSGVVQSGPETGVIRQIWENYERSSYGKA